MKKLIFLLFVLMVFVGFAKQAYAVPGALPSTYNLKEGDLIGASAYSDPDIFIINENGYKRLFLNPKIFSFYGHLGGFKNVKPITATARDQFETSLLFRNCETNDQKVYALEVTGEDTGTLHPLNMSGTAAATEDPYFFKKVFCINNNEYNWYTKGSPYTSLSQIPVYNRGGGAGACSGFEVRYPLVNTSETRFVKFSFSSTGCAKGVAVDASNTASFENYIDVGHVYATGEMSLASDLCGLDSQGSLKCVPYQTGAQLYYRLVDLATDKTIFVGQPFSIPVSSTPTPTPDSNGMLTYTHFDKNIPFMIQYPNSLCITLDIGSVVVHDYTSPCGGNNSIATTQHYLAITAFPLGIETQSELVSQMQSGGAIIYSENRTIGGYQAFKYQDDNLYGWAFMTNNVMSINGVNYKYSVFIELDLNGVANAQEIENAIINSFSIPGR